MFGLLQFLERRATTTTTAKEVATETTSITSSTLISTTLRTTSNTKSRTTSDKASSTATTNDGKKSTTLTQAISTSQTTPTQTTRNPHSSSIPDTSNNKGNSGLSAGAKAGIAIGVVAGVALLILIAFLLLRRSRNKRFEAIDESKRESFYPVQNDPVPPPAIMNNWIPPTASTTPATELESNDGSSSIQRSSQNTYSPPVTENRMSPLPNSLRVGVAGDSRQADIPDFPTGARNLSKSNIDALSDPGIEPIHEMEATPGPMNQAIPGSFPGTSASQDDFSDKVFVSQSGPNDNLSKIQEIEAAKARLQERRKRLVELQYVDEEEEKLNHQLATLRSQDVMNNGS